MNNPKDRLSIRPHQLLGFLQLIDEGEVSPKRRTTYGDGMAEVFQGMIDAVKNNPNILIYFVLKDNSVCRPDCANMNVAGPCDLTLSDVMRDEKNIYSTYFKKSLSTITPPGYTVKELRDVVKARQSENKLLQLLK